MEADPGSLVCNSVASWICYAIHALHDYRFAPAAAPACAGLSSGAIWLTMKNPTPKRGSQYFCKNDFSSTGWAGPPAPPAAVAGLMGTGGARSGLLLVNLYI